MSDKYIPLPQTELNAETIKSCFLSPNASHSFGSATGENTVFLATSAPDYIPLYLSRLRTYFAPSTRIFLKKHFVFYFRD